jgi:tRNA pseudouridine38-40 synthase
MVRIMTGTLLKIAQGKIEKGAIPGIIDAKDRSCAGVTAPAHGLYLNKVKYPFD